MNAEISKLIKAERVCWAREAVLMSVQTEH